MVLIPVYDDWVALNELIGMIDEVFSQTEYRVSLLIVNDGSVQVPSGLDYENLRHINLVRCLHLATNQGHQRAIAIGLAQLAREDCDLVLVMDADGEDQPQHILVLLDQHRLRADHIVVARRTTRSEGIPFRIFYSIYKLLFRLATGSQLRFGNFSLIPCIYLTHLTHRSDLWNHLSATIRRSKLPLIEVPLPRGQRLAGESSMNFVALILHGFSGISVYLDMFIARMLLFASMLILLAGIGIVAAVLVRYLTELAIPGWATTVVGILIIIMVQLLFFLISLLLTLLNSRSRRQFIPALDASAFVERQEIWLDRTSVLRD